VNSLSRRARPRLPALPAQACVVALACALSLHPASAQTPQAAAVAPASTVVVTAARAPLKLSDVDADVTVVTREDIERSGYGDIADLLRATGSVEFVRNGGPGTTTGVSIRGSAAQHTLVLVNGIRIGSQAGSGGASWEAIPLDQIDHIEIVAGPASSMYGSDAIGGVVQIFTIKGHGAPRLGVGAAAGSYGTRRADAGVSGSSGAFDYALGAATESSDGFQIVTDPASFNFNPYAAGYHKHSATARLGAQLDADDRVEVFGLFSHLETNFNAFDPVSLGFEKEDQSAHKLSWERAWSRDISTQVAYSESRAKLDDVTDVYRTATRERTWSVDGSWRTLPGQQLLFVFDHLEDRLTDNSLTPSAGAASRHDDGAALGYLWQQGPFDAQAHYRHDEDSEFGGVDTGSLGLGWHVTPAVKLVALAGNAFRAPTIYQNTSGYGPLSLPGGQSLRPESAHSAELGVHYDAGASSASLTAWRNRVDELIDFQASENCLTNDFGCYVNVQRALLRGATVKAATTAAGVDWSATFTWQEPKDETTGKRLPRRARTLGSLRAQAPVGGWTLGGTLVYSGKRFNDAANTTPLGAYAITNLDVSYALTRELKLQGNVDNAFDRRYQTAAGYAQAGRTWLLGLRYTPAL